MSSGHGSLEISGSSLEEAALVAQASSKASSASSSSRTTHKDSVKRHSPARRAGVPKMSRGKASSSDHHPPHLPLVPIARSRAEEMQMSSYEAPDVDQRMEQPSAYSLQFSQVNAQYVDRP